MLTQERAEKLSGILTANPERAKALFDLVPTEALSQINALGNDFTLDEINEFGQAVKEAAAQGELNADALDDVAGGALPFAVAAACVGAGWLFGQTFGSKGNW